MAIDFGTVHVSGLVSHNRTAVDVDRGQALLARIARAVGRRLLRSEQLADSVRESRFDWQYRISDREFQQFD